MTIRRLVAVLAIGVVACDKRAPPAATQPDAATAAARTAPQIPPFATVSRFVVKLEQGGPATLRCNGVVSEITIDLVTDEWSNASCLSAAKPGVPPGAADPLVVDHGALSTQGKKRIEDAWGRVRVDAGASGCASDAGALTLDVTLSDGGVSRWYERSGGCPRGTTAFAAGVSELSGVVRMTLAKPTGADSGTDPGDTKRRGASP